MNNDSKVSLPSSTILNFYYYFSYISYFITCLITPLLLYVILTQSKEMKGYKWFILNHSFWCLGFETIIGIFKPIILTPAFSGFSLTMRDGSYYFTAVITVIGFLCSTNYGVGLSLTIGSRYLTTFPSIFSKWLTKKSFVLIAAFASTVCTIVVTTFTITSFNIDINGIREKAKKYDSFFEHFNESALLFFPIYENKFVVYLSFITLTLLLITGIFVMFFFIYLIKTTHATASITKMQKSLIISSVAQILLTMIFFVLPNVIGVSFILFEIPHTANLTCIIFCFVGLHSLMEFIATLYFVLPYRKYLKKQFSRLFKTGSIPPTQIIPSMSTQLNSTDILNR